MSRAARLAGLLLLSSLAHAGLVQPALAVVEPDPWPPPSPYRILGSNLSAPPFLDVVVPCLPPGGSDGPEAELAEAISLARTSASAKTARADLLQSLTPAASELGRACVELELARLRLSSGLLPEARVHASRALRAFARSDASPATQRAVRFYRAESFYRSGDIERAEVLYRELAKGQTPASRAAQLRLAEIAYVKQPDVVGLLRVEESLERVSDSGLDVSAWWPRLAEWSLREDPAKALGWIERALEGLDGPEAEALELRRVDLLYHSGERIEGRESLRELAATGRDAAVRQLATVRLSDLERRRGDDALRQLEAAADSALPGLSAYARGILARALIEKGELERALEHLVRLVHDASDADIVPNRTQMFDAVLNGMTHDAVCSDIIAGASGRRDLLMRSASLADPFLRLGDCYLEYGLADAAFDTYRSTAKAFGPAVISQLTLRTARAQYRIGQLSPALAAARSSVARSVEPSSGWRLLYGQILLHEDRPREAVEALEPVWSSIERAAGKGQDAETSYQALLLSARAALRYRAPTALRAELRSAVARAAENPEFSAVVAEASLLVADLYRISADVDVSSEFYARAFALLEPGPLHSRAGYWHGLFQDDQDRTREIWSEIIEREDSWARLAASEIQLAEGRVAVGSTDQIKELRMAVANRAAAK